MLFLYFLSFPKISVYPASPEKLSTFILPKFSCAFLMVSVYLASPKISCSPWLLFPLALSCLLLEVWLSNDVGSWVGGVFNFHMCVTFTFVFQYIGVTHGLENVVDPRP